MGRTEIQSEVKSTVISLERGIRTPYLEPSLMSQGCFHTIFSSYLDIVIVY